MAITENPTDILNRLLSELIPGNHNMLGKGFGWKESGDFYNFDFSDIERIEEEFSHEYHAAVAQIQASWGQPDFSGDSNTSGYPDWYWMEAIAMSYWTREEGIAYVSFDKEDIETPYFITLGAISEESIEEIRENGLFYR